MSHAANQSDPTVPAAPRRGARMAAPPFAGVIDAVIVEEPVPFAFPGSISRPHAEAGWVWVHRDLCPDLIAADAVAEGRFTARELDGVIRDVLARMKAGLDLVAGDPEKDRRLRAALGSTEARDALPTLMLALRSRALLTKAKAFGNAINSLSDDNALGVALQSMPLQDQALAALLFHAAIGQVNNPTRLVNSLIKRAGGATEAAIIRQGFTPVVDAILAHAQNQIHVLQPMGAFADIDLVCRSLERFHRLVRSLTGYIEFSRGSRWAMVLSGITKQVSDRIEPRLRDVVSDLNLAMRRGREGSDRLDSDQILAAINGVYLMATVRECRDSLALNSLFEQAWSQSGQALEQHLQRNLDLIRTHPDDVAIRARLDAGIKMAEVRFNLEYAETLRRARATAGRRG